MEVSRIKFTAGLDGVIVCELYNNKGEVQDLTGCVVTFKLGYEYDDNAFISETMVLLGSNKCMIQLTPLDTDLLSIGEYEIQLIIIDQTGKKHGTEKVKVSIDRPFN